MSEKILPHLLPRIFWIFVAPTSVDGIVIYYVFSELSQHVDSIDIHQHFRRFFWIFTGAITEEHFDLALAQYFSAEY